MWRKEDIRDCKNDSPFDYVSARFNKLRVNDSFILSLFSSFDLSVIEEVQTRQKLLSKRSVRIRYMSIAKQFLTQYEQRK